MEKGNPGKYIVWLVCYIGDIIPLVVMLLQLLGVVSMIKRWVPLPFVWWWRSL